MDRQILEAIRGEHDNYILPFLWMRGEEEAVIRKEMEKIAKCGIRAVCLESRPHPDFAGPKWWRDVDIVLEEARKRGMKVWFLDDSHFPTGKANGLLPVKYPERAKQYLSLHFYDVTGPLSHGELDVSAACKKTMTWLDLGKPVEAPLMKEEQLLSVVAMPLLEGDTADAARCRVLTGEVRDGRLVADFPAGVWRVYVAYTTYDGGAHNDYINIIDEASVQVLLEAVYEPHYRRYREEFGKTIAGFFSDEPGFGNTFGFAMDDRIGRKDMPLPWNKDMPKLLEERLGDGWREKLPLLFMPFKEEAETARVRYAYMDAATRLYEKNFSGQLGAWCRERGVSYIGHVIEDQNEHARLGCGAGHYFRAMSGQSMAGIDNIGGQLLPGNPDTTRHGFSTADGPFFHYAELKMGASAALMQPEKEGRLMCETFGAYGWSFGVRDMKWVADELLVNGVNHLVPHAFSMAPYPDTDCPPHFYARGMNPEFPYFGKLMEYCNRLCHVFSGGKWIPEVGILYHAEQEWMGETMLDQLPARALHEGQIDYAFVPADALLDACGEGDGRYPAVVRDGRVVINGVPLKMLLIPEGQFADPALLRFMKRYPEVKVIFVEGAPEAVKAEFSPQIVPLRDLVVTIRSMGVIGARADVKGEAAFFHYEKESGDLWMVFNESRSEPIYGNLLMKVGGDDRRIWRYDAMYNRIYPVEQLPARGFDEPRMLCTLEVKPYESAVFFTATEEEMRGIAEEQDPWMIHERRSREIMDGWGVELKMPGEGTDFLPLKEALDVSRELGRPVAEDARQMAEAFQEKLLPISDLLPTFSGTMRYTREVNVTDPEQVYELRVEHLHEVGRLLVNGEEADFRLCPPYRFRLRHLRPGRNTLTLEVASTPVRDVLNYPQEPLGYEKGFYEPSGIFGRVTLTELG